MSGDEDRLPSGTRDALDAVERLLHRYQAIDPGEAALAARLILDGRDDPMTHIERVLRPPGEREEDAPDEGELEEAEGSAEEPPEDATVETGTETPDEAPAETAAEGPEAAPEQTATPREDG